MGWELDISHWAKIKGVWIQPSMGRLPQAKRLAES